MAYTLRQFGAMIRDRARMEAFAAAIATAVRPGDVVLDVGAGTGIFALLACRAGARHVYAVDVNPLVNEGVETARRNGYEDRITLIHGDASTIDLTEQVDVLLGDIRGRLPGFDLALDLYRDLATRHLRPGGRVIPQSDTVHVAPLSAGAVYDDEVRRPWIENPFGLDLTASLPSIVSAMVPYRLSTDVQLVEPQPWLTLDYVTGRRHEPSQWLQFRSTDETTVHFLALWFDTVLYGDIGYSNDPRNADRPLVYNQILLPLVEPVVLTPDDRLDVALRADPVAGDFIFTYTIRVLRDGDEQPRLERRQSTFDSLPLHEMRRRSASHVPRLGPDAQLVKTAIDLMDGSRPLAEISEQLTRAFPKRLPTHSVALEYVADLAQRYGE